MWQVASEAYAYLAGHPFLTDTVLHNRKTDNDTEITTTQHAAAEINQLTNQHTHTKKHSRTARPRVPPHMKTSTEHIPFSLNLIFFLIPYHS